jgi:flagellar protein FliO/FliZ
MLEAVASIAAGSAPAAAVGTSAGAGIGVGSIAGLLVSLLLVIGIILVAAWLLRRLPGMGGHGGSGLLRVRASLPLGMKERVVLVEAAGETLLLGVTAGGIRCLHRFDEPLPPQSQSEGGFAQLLAERIRGKESGR